MTAPPVLKAKAEAAAARADLQATVAEIKERLSPGNVAHDAWERVRDKGQDAWERARDTGEDLAERGVDLAVRKPGAVAGVASIAALLVVRRPVIRAVRRLFSRRAPAPAPVHPARSDDRAVQEEILP